MSVCPYSGGREEGSEGGREVRTRYIKNFRIHSFMIL